MLINYNLVFDRLFQFHRLCFSRVLSYFIFYTKLYFLLQIFSAIRRFSELQFVSVTIFLAEV